MATMLEPRGPMRPNIASADVQVPAIKDFEQVDREVGGTLGPTKAWFMALGAALVCLGIGIPA